MKDLELSLNVPGRSRLFLELDGFRLPNGPNSSGLQARNETTFVEDEDIDHSYTSSKKAEPLFGGCSGMDHGRSSAQKIPLVLCTQKTKGLTELKAEAFTLEDLRDAKAIEDSEAFLARAAKGS